VGTSLAEILDAAAHARFPPDDGGVTVVAQPGHRDAGVIAFTAHSVFTDEDAGWVRATLAAVGCDPLTATTSGSGPPTAASGSWAGAWPAAGRPRSRSIRARAAAASAGAWPWRPGTSYRPARSSGRSRPPATRAASAPFRQPATGRSGPRRCFSRHPDPGARIAARSAAAPRTGARPPPRLAASSRQGQRAQRSGTADRRGAAAAASGVQPARSAGVAHRHRGPAPGRRCR
jgi:hypothetical protein